jgi:hypothetical protein
VNSDPAAPSPSPVSVGFDADANAPAADAPKPVREIPVWAVVGVVLICLGGAAWFVWANWLRSGPAERIVFLDRGPDDGVKQVLAGRYDVRSGNAALTVIKKGDAGADLDFRWAKQEYLTAEQIRMLTIVLRLTRDQAMAEELNMTPEQMERLKANRAKAKVELSESDRARLTTLVLAYDAEKDKDAKRKAETKLIKALDAVAAQLEGSAKQLAAERTADAKTILSEEQLRRWDAMGRGPEPDKPATPPAARGG